MNESAAQKKVRKEPIETMYVDKDEVACDGGSGPMGHPRVFLYLTDGEVMCPYCSRLFIHKH